MIQVCFIIFIPCEEWGGWAWGSEHYKNLKPKSKLFGYCKYCFWTLKNRIVLKSQCQVHKVLNVDVVWKCSTQKKQAWKHRNLSREKKAGKVEVSKQTHRPYWTIGLSEPVYKAQFFLLQDDFAFLNFLKSVSSF